MSNKFYLNRVIFIFLLVILLSYPVSSVEYKRYDFQYDANGNLMQGKDNYYEYDDFNRISKTREGNSNGKIIAEYFYDYNGDRVKKIEYTNEGKLITYYIGDNLVREIKISKTEDTVYYYLDNTLIGRKDFNGRKYYYHPDHIGSTNLITDSSGLTSEYTTYLPFGEIEEGGKDRYLFTGKEKDDNGLYYYGARYYDSYLSRFIQPDSVIQDIYNPQNLNRYSYVLNNPYRYTDSTGNYIESALDIISITWSLSDLRNDPKSITNWISLGADAVTLALPGVAAGGTIVKGITKGQKGAIKVAKMYEKGADSKDIIKALKNVPELEKISSDIRKIDKIKNSESFRVILPDGRIRIYENLRLSKKEGEAIGQRAVKEIDPITKETKRVWMENYDKDGNVIIVHPKYPKDLEHIKTNPKKIEKNEKSK